MKRRGESSPDTGQIYETRFQQGSLTGHAGQLPAVDAKTNNDKPSSCWLSVVPTKTAELSGYIKEA